jgi:hypothetical protein
MATSNDKDTSTAVTKNFEFIEIPRQDPPKKPAEARIREFGEI